MRDGINVCPLTIFCNPCSFVYNIVFLVSQLSSSLHAHGNYYILSVNWHFIKQNEWPVIGSSTYLQVSLRCKRSIRNQIPFCAASYSVTKWAYITLMYPYIHHTSSLHYNRNKNVNVPVFGKVVRSLNRFYDVDITDINSSCIYIYTACSRLDCAHTI